jgi:hypothetical protein
VTAGLLGELTGDAARDAARIDAAVEEQVQAVGRANISRAISDLVRAGLMTRHYAGYATNHKNRGVGAMRSTGSNRRTGLAAQACAGATTVRRAYKPARRVVRCPKNQGLRGDNYDGRLSGDYDGR